MRNRFDEQLAQLNRELTLMGAMCEEVIAYAAKALTTGDTSFIEKTVSIELYEDAGHDESCNEGWFNPHGFQYFICHNSVYNCTSLCDSFGSTYFPGSVNDITITLSFLKSWTSVIFADKLNLN